MASYSLNEDLYKLQNITFFDLETTGLLKKNDFPHILQIGAVRAGGKKFEVYVRPERDIHPKASEVNGFTIDGQQLRKNGENVPSLPIKEALEKFFEFLNDEAVLGGHNIIKFDCKVLYYALMKTDLADRFKEKIRSCIDNLPAFKNMFPGESSYKQPDLVEKYLGKNVPSNIHDAVVDASLSKELFDFAFKQKSGEMEEYLRPWDEIVKKYSF